MKKASLIVLIITAACCAIGLCACNGEHEHKYKKTVYEPTCFEEGYTLLECSCGKNYAVNVVEPRHDLEPIEGTQGTCEKFGTMEHFKCVRCKRTFKDRSGEDQIKDEKEIRMPMVHGYLDGVCTLCGKKQPTELIYSTDSDSLYASVIGLKDVTETDVVIPDYFGIYEVVAIGDDAFSGCQNLTHVEIPDTVMIIGDNAFAGCTSLKNITISEKMESIGKSAFIGCNSLESVTILGKLYLIDKAAFSGCKSLKSLTMQNYESIYGSVITSTNIKEDAFLGCTALEEVRFEGTPEQWAQIDFENASSNPLGFTKNMYFNGESLTELNFENVRTIKPYAFVNCEAITSISLSDGVVTIGDCAFYNCVNLSDISFADSVRIIGKGVVNNTAFYNNSANWKDGELYIGKHLIEISDYGVNYTTYEVKPGTLTIAANAFSYCCNLIGVALPEGLVNIGEEAFKNCEYLAAVFDGTSLFVEKGSKRNGYVAYYAREIYKLSDKERVKISDVNGFATLTDGDSKILVRYIGSGTKPILPDDITEIGSRAFSGRNYITDILIPSGVKLIGDYAFFGCYGATNLSIPESVESIGNYAFSNCSNLTSVTIPDGVKVIGKSAFYGCSALADITLPDSVESIGVDAFLKTAYSENINNWDEGVLYIGRYLVYANYEMPGEYEIKKDTILIADGAFVDTRLNGIVIPSSVRFIGEKFLDRYFVEIYYFGTEKEWKTVSVAVSNDALKAALVYYYSETEPPVHESGRYYVGKYWRYSRDTGKPEVWIKNMHY